MSHLCLRHTNHSFLSEIKIKLVFGDFIFFLFAFWGFCFMASYLVSYICLILLIKQAILSSLHLSYLFLACILMMASESQDGCWGSSLLVCNL